MKKTKIQLEEIAKKHSSMTYQELYQYIIVEIEKGKLTPVKASKTNGKKPALYNAYWKYEEQTDYSDVQEELKYQINPALDITYYQCKPDKYKGDRKNIHLLSEYLVKRKQELEVEKTINERSFEIFHREKFLDREGGMELLKRLEFPFDKLNFYKTSEPMAYYSHKKTTPQKFLIVENKDTFYSMRKHLIDGSDNIMGMEIGTLIYGGGKAIYKSFQDYSQAVEPYFAHEKNRVYYFGDLDYEGILIYETLSEKYKDEVEIILFKTAYEKMLQKAEQIGVTELPDTKEGQNKNIGTHFFDQFSLEIQVKMKQILENNKYIPQEIVNASDY